MSSCWDVGKIVKSYDVRRETRLQFLDRVQERCGCDVAAAVGRGLLSAAVVGNSFSSDALAHATFLFETEHRRLRLLANENKFFGLPPIARRHMPRWLQSCANTSGGKVVEFHVLAVPMGWNRAVWFVQQMLEHLLPDEVGETNLRHLLPNPTLG